MAQLALLAPSVTKIYKSLVVRACPQTRAVLAPHNHNNVNA